MGQTAQDLTFAAARLRALDARPYYAAGLLSCVPVPRPDDPALPTMAIDARWRLYYNPAWVTDVGAEIAATGLMHELNHVLRNHHERFSGVLASEPGHAEVVNAAEDCEINDDLEAEHLPCQAGWCFPKTYRLPNGKMAEWYYAALLKTATRITCPSDCGSGAHGQPRPWEEPGEGKGDGKGDGDHGLSPIEAELVRRKVAKDVLDHAKGRGDVPAGLKRWAEGVLNPTLPWQSILGGRVRTVLADRAGRVDYTFSRPSRRQGAIPDVLMPGMCQPILRVGLVVDSSGSMDDGRFMGALSEGAGVLRAAGVEEVWGYVCDAAVHAAVRIRRPADVRKLALGGGGTDMTIGMAAAMRRRPRPQVLIVISDCDSPWPSHAPRGVSVIVVRVGSHSPAPSWATVIDVPAGETAGA